MSASALSQALEYAGLGYGVFPVRPLDKVPATKNGLKDATTDPDIIRRWPDVRNLGILPPERVLVWDADTPEEVERAEREFPELRAAPRDDTPSGGAHFYLRLPDGATPPKTNTRVHGRQLDVRGLGKAYLVAAPSITPKGRYQWVRPLVPPDELPEASPELLAFLSPQKKTPAPIKATRAASPQEGSRERRYAEVALQKEYDAVAAAVDGTRNHTLSRAAFSLGQLVGAGVLEQEEVEAALRGAAETCGLDTRETEATLKSGLEAGMAAPREIPAPKQLVQRRALQLVAQLLKVIATVPEPARDIR